MCVSTFPLYCLPGWTSTAVLGTVVVDVVGGRGGGNRGSWSEFISLVVISSFFSLRSLIIKNQQVLSCRCRCLCRDNTYRVLSLNIQIDTLVPIDSDSIRFDSVSIYLRSKIHFCISTLYLFRLLSLFSLSTFFFLSFFLFICRLYNTNATADHCCSTIQFFFVFVDGFHSGWHACCTTVRTANPRKTNKITD